VTEPRTPVRDLAIGISVAAGCLGLVFFGTVGMVEAAILILVVVILIWISTVDARRLVDERGRPALMLFGLGALGIALVFTAAVMISTVTEYMILLVGVTAWSIGLLRALRFGWRLPPREP
jgi:hypothetical protein